MAARPSGWYDDPHDDARLRYWDGVIWTDHTANKRPTPPPQDRVAADPRAGHPTSWSGPGSHHEDQHLRRRDVRGDRAAYARSPAGFGAASDRVEAPLSSWWRRAVAFVVDSLLVALICFPFTASRAAALSDQVTAWFGAVRQAASGGGAVPVMSPEIMQAAMWVSLVQTLVYLLLEVVLLSRFGVTPGRLLTGIRVRLASHDARPPAVAVFRRTIVKNISNLLGGLPLISFFAAVFQVVDYLWPLRDRRNQALHDKVGDTIVVRGRPSRAPGGPQDGGTRGP